MTDDVRKVQHTLKMLSAFRRTTKGQEHQRTQTLRTKFPKCFYFTKTKNTIIISFKEGNIKND